MATKQKRRRKKRDSQAKRDQFWAKEKRNHQASKRGLPR
jgi:hypothetical protein